MKRFLGTLALVVASGLLIGDATGADEKGKAKKLDGAALFKKLDANSDGKVTTDEFKNITELPRIGERLKDKPELVDRLFGKLDANGDKSLSEDEFKKLVEVVGELRKKKDK